MRKAIWLAMMCTMLAQSPAPHPQRQIAPPVTDPKEPKYLTDQTRKMGGPMPAEQLAPIFDHLDLQGLQVVLRRHFYRAALPKAIARRGKLRVRWQTPDNLPFPMPLDVRVDGKVVTLPMTGGAGEIAAGEHAAVTIDPCSRILMQSDAIDEFQAWPAANPESRRR